MVINRAKFDACTYISFRGVKTDRQIDTQTDGQNYTLYVRLCFFIYDMFFVCDSTLDQACLKCGPHQNFKQPATSVVKISSNKIPVQ